MSTYRRKRIRRLVLCDVCGEPTVADLREWADGTSLDASERVETTDGPVHRPYYHRCSACDAYVRAENHERAARAFRAKLPALRAACDRSRAKFRAERAGVLDRDPIATRARMRNDKETPE